jgi:hypothetical protein
MSDEPNAPTETPEASVPHQTEKLGVTGSRRERVFAAIEWALLAVSYLMLFFEFHGVGADGGQRFDALTQFLTTYKLPSTRYSMVGPIFSAPIWYLGKWWLKDPKLACGYYNWAVLGVFVVLVARMLRGIVDPPIARRFLLLLVAGSMFANHVQAYYAEVFTAACVAMGTLAVCTKKCSWLGWVAIVLGSANTPGVGVGAAALCMFFTVDRRRLRYLLPVLAIGAIIAFETFVRRKGKTGYEDVHQNKTLMPYSGISGFSYPMYFGLLGLVFSFGKGILFYAPGVFAPVTDLLEGAEPLVKAYRAWLCFLVGIMLVYAKFCGWYGGVFWGPRYVLFASVPASFALAVNMVRARSFVRTSFTLAALTLSIWIGAEGVVFGQRDLKQCWENGYALEHLCWYVPEFSAWLRPLVVHKVIEKLDWAFLAMYATIYVYLAVPVISQLARAARPHLVSEGRRLMEWRRWSF